MTNLLLSLSMFAAVFAPADPNSMFVEDSLTRAQQILSIKDETDRTSQMCSLLSQRIGSNHISSLWLGTFANLSRDQVAAHTFRAMVPSIVMSKVLPLFGSGTNASLVVDAISKSRGIDIFEVGVTVKSGGRDYSGTAIVKETAGVLTIIDAEYRGGSGVDYQGREYQKFLNREYGKDPVNSLPVTALVQSVLGQDDYVACP